MKLAFLIYNYFPYGGLQRDFRRIVGECVRRGHDVTVYTMKWQGEPIAGVTLVRVSCESYSRLRVYRRFTDRVRAELSRTPADSVIGFNKMPGLDIYFAADPCFAEKAATQRGAYYRFTPRYRHFIRYEAAVFGAGSATRVLILSPQQQAAFERHYPGCGDRLTLIPPGLDLDRRPTGDATEGRMALRAELGLEGSDLLVLQVGSGFRVKGVDRSLRAIGALPDELRRRVTYLLIGQDKPGRYLRLADRLGIADRVRTMPGRDDIPRFLQSADLLLHPAYAESAGYVLLEATVAGLPVLTTATCGYAFHVEKACAGLVCAEPFSQRELNDRLVAMLTSPDDRLQWHRNGLAYGQQDSLFSMPGVAADLIEGYTAGLSAERGAA